MGWVQPPVLAWRKEPAVVRRMPHEIEFDVEVVTASTSIVTLKLKLFEHQMGII